MMNTCDEKLSRIAKLDNTERELELSISFSKTGKINIAGELQERPDLNNRLVFEIKSDQTCILLVIKELEAIRKVFGDMKGIKITFSSAFHFQRMFYMITGIIKISSRNPQLVYSKNYKAENIGLKEGFSAYWENIEYR